MKKIEEIQQEIATELGYGNWYAVQHSLKAFNSKKWLDTMYKKVVQRFAEQQVSIAVEKYKAEISYLKRDFNYALQDSGYLSAIEDAVSLAPQILDELKGGE